MPANTDVVAIWIETDKILRGFRYMFHFKMIVLIIVCCFFIFFGVNLLISSYSLNDPYSFMITFFASNLMILISAALGLGFTIRLVRYGNASPVDNDGTENE